MLATAYHVARRYTLNELCSIQLYRYITTYSSSLSQIAQTRVSSQDSVEDPEAERPVSALPGHHGDLNHQGHDLTQEVITLSFAFFYSASNGNKYIFSYTWGLCGEKTGKPALLVHLYCNNAGRTKCKGFFSIKSFGAFFPVFTGWEAVSILQNKLNVGKNGVF